MRKLVSLVILVSLVAACGGASKEELASLAAKGYYEHLIHGEYEQFYEGMDQRELSGEAGYRSQMLVITFCSQRSHLLCCRVPTGYP